MHEAALRQEVGGTTVMRGQRDHLAEIATRGVANIRVVPMDAGAHPGMEGPFVILEYLGLPGAVHLENRVASLNLEEEEDVRAYTLAFRGLLSIARPL